MYIGITFVAFKSVSKHGFDGYGFGPYRKNTGGAFDLGELPTSGGDWKIGWWVILSEDM